MEDLRITLDQILDDFKIEELDLILVMKYLDKDLDGLIKFSDFAYQLMPKSKKHQELMKNKEANIVGTEFSFKMVTISLMISLVYERDPRSNQNILYQTHYTF